jgi:hypothetical protein
MMTVSVRMIDSNEELAARLRAHVQMMAALIGERNGNRPSALSAVRSVIRRELESLGLTVTPFDYLLGSNRECQNLIVELPGARHDLSPIVVGAHYDTAPGTPGADDNASAVAMLIELIRVLRASPHKRNLRCVFFDCEEPPHFGSSEMGSFRDAKHLAEAGARIDGMICLESLGYFPKRVDPRVHRPAILRALDFVLGGRSLITVSDLRSIGFLFRFGWRFSLATLYRGVYPVITIALPRAFGYHALSDHRSYWHHGHRALMLTNTAMLRNPNYHLPTDLPDTLDYHRMAGILRALVSTVARM